MKISSEQYERILKFLDGDMTVEEMNEFEKELAVNPEMRSQIDFEESVRDTLGAAYAENDKENSEEKNIQKKVDSGIREQIERMREQWRELNKRKPPIPSEPAKQSKRTNIIPFGSLTAIAAACVLIAAAGLVWFIINRNTGSPVINSQKINSSKQDSQAQNEINRASDSLNLIKSPGTQPDLTSLYKQYFKKDAAPEIKPMLLAEALNDYENNDYKLLQNLDLSSLPTDRSASSSNINSRQNIKELGYYYKGLAFMETKHDLKAIENLQWVIDSAQNEPLQIKAQWYMALIQLKNHNVDKTISLLAIISGTHISPYNTMAKQLLPELKQDVK
ncbi:MAG TPA: hypothetical protein VFW07_06350 [Parafilimonas sp.]|nr:hypothetical protein [Parafilimonas sp.]